MIKVLEKETSFYITNFLDLAKQYHIENFAKKLNLNLQYLNQGERKIACISLEKIENISSPISYLKIKTREELQHNEIMGAVLNVGLKREYIGDIYCQDKLYYLAVIEKYADYLIENVHYISSYKVCLEVTDEKIPQANHEIKTCIVSSLRLDSVVSSIFHVSREKAKEAIFNQEVFYNFSNFLKIEQHISFPCFLSFRKKGKVKIHQVLKSTRKENFVLEVEFF